MSKFRSGAVAALSAAAVLLAGCTTTGVGTGDITQKGKPAEAVKFTWKSTDGGITGTMTASLPAAVYSGPFVQITQRTEAQALAPLWAGYPPGWTDWSYWGYGGMNMGMGMPMYDAVQFSTVYTGKVLANLKTPAGGQMRCRLHMLVPSQGMSGGGTGECQILNGATIQANF